ncbi:hypothetical protein [uncultured Draconibacterium sp.]|uniref:hypothetical protein n=1 Tax=uncultured Draconibacterium sp. TaxID=1573823 RepID=UPI0029C670AF|nr:hypothetical protein [uncultured Draconibacterium sp.]
MKNKRLKIIGFYVLSALMLFAFWLLDNSEKLTNFLEKTDRVMTNWAMGFYAIIGIVKLVLITAGLAIPVILTIMIIINKKNGL